MAVPTIVPAPSFDPESDANDLRKAMKGMGTDEDAIINIITKRTSAQRQAILERYNINHERDLMKDLKKELSGNFQDVAVALMTPTDKFLAMELHKAMEGVGTNENILIEVLCSRDNASIWEIKKAYQELYGKELYKDIKKETSDDFEDVLLDLCKCDRDESGTKDDIAGDLAAKLYKAGEGRKGADEDEIRKILSNQSFSTLRLVFSIYRAVTGNTLGEVMEKELEGNFKKAMLALYNCIQCPASYFAEVLNQAIKGLGTNNRTLIRVLVTRSEIDLENIKKEYNTIYDKTLKKAVKGDTSGNFEKTLLAIIGE